ncbi:hypothetical protein ZIOFF_054128 [Zingiber officinale]|uniref:2Fe-2S ferredoxin-type domain-containing protein n=1 Tax=Zingiber officinale TaxID=94328 RepID=A0A8J5KJ67_ZINOF|nr:hypothetical protein ZIOFF_054128 [Zingiber officinale]
MGLLQLNPPAVSSIPTIARRFPHTPSSLKLLRHCRLFAIATNPASSDGSAAPDNDEPPSIDFAFVHVSPARNEIDIIPRVGFLMTPRGGGAAEADAGRPAGRALPVGLRRPEAEGHHAGPQHRSLRTICEYVRLLLSRVVDPLQRFDSMKCQFVQDGPLLNCSGGGICGTCLVEVVELPRSSPPPSSLIQTTCCDNLQRFSDDAAYALQTLQKPKTWRLACQTVVGNKDTRGELVIQQLPDWKVHNWEDLRASEELEFE